MSMTAGLEPFQILTASMDNVFGFPIVLGAPSDRARKIKLQGTVVAMFPEHSHLVVEETRNASGVLMVTVDSRTRFRNKLKQSSGVSLWDSLHIHDEVLVEGVQSGGAAMLALMIALRRRPLTLPRPGKTSS